MIELQTRRELFVDNFLVEAMGNARLKLWMPRIEEIPTAGGVYNTVILDGKRYRLYYRDTVNFDYQYSGHPSERVCYAESADGINYTIPDFGTAGEKHGPLNNVILAEPTFCANFSPFIDTRPGTPPEQRYKAISGLWHNNHWQMRRDGLDVPKGFEAGLYTFASADGLNWNRLEKHPAITSVEKAFDSQNLAFWSEHENCYVCYFRTWGPGGFEHGLRSIARSTSTDFINWSKAADMHTNAAPEELYTSQTAPYFRAPHIYLAFPTRYMRDRDSSTDILFMSSRGGNSFDRSFRDAIMRPGLDPERWLNRANYASLNLVPLDERTICVYVFSRSYPGREKSPALMLKFRTDGIASLHSGWQGGTVLTKPFTFAGNELELNYSTSAAGLIRGEIIGADGLPAAGFAMDDCEELVGDKITGTINWRGGSLKPLAGKPVRLRFFMQEADLFSMRFRESAEKQA